MRKIKFSFPVFQILKLYHAIKLKTKHATELDYDFVQYRKYKKRNKNIGYMVCNKPKYLPNDTLKFKAYILGAKNRPLKENLSLVVCEQYYSKPIMTRTLKQTKPGVYTGEIVLNDSLKLDENYRISLHSLKDKDHDLVSCNFKYEDYLLDEISYHSRLEYESLDSNTSQILYLKATDINSFNLPDIKYDVTVSIKYINNYYNDIVYIKDTLFKTTGYLSLDNETRIIIPDTLFQPMNGNYDVEITYTNSNFEKQTDDLVFSVNRKPGDFYLKQNGRTLNISSANNIRKTLEDLYLIGYDKNDDTLVYHKIKLPDKVNINQAVESYELYSPNLDIDKEFIVENIYIELNSYRSKDSVFFKLDNPENLLVNYKIFKENKLILNNKDSVCFFKCADASLSSYFAVVDYLWAGEMKQLQSAAVVFEKDVNIKINTPHQVFPGQKVNLKIKATDFYDKPIKQLDLTAWSITEQFKDFDDPLIPYLGKGKPLRRQNEYVIGSLYKYNNYHKTKFKLDTFWLKQLHLDTIPFYNVRSGSVAFLNCYDTIDKNIAEFAPFIFDNLRQVPIHMIYIDHKLVYYAYASQGLPYAFTAGPGYHKIKLRTSNKIFEIDSVLFQAGFKLEMALDYNKGFKNLFSYSAENFLTTTERDELRSKIFFLNKNFTDELFVWQRDQAVHHFKGGRHDVIAIGPFNGLSKLKYYMVNNLKKEFLFESGYDYSISKENIIMKENNRLTDKQIPFPNIDKKPVAGEHCIEESDFMFPDIVKAAPRLDELYSTEYPKNPGLGRVKWTPAFDSIISYVMLENMESHDLKFYNSNYSNLYNLKPGAYKLFLLTSKFYGQCKMFFIKPNTTTCLIFKSEKTTYFEQVKNEYNCQLQEQEYKKELLRNSEKGIKQNGNSYFDVSYYENSSKGDAQVKVVVYDKATHETVPFATVVLFKNQQEIAAVAANIDGEVLFKGLQSGKNYNVKISYVGYSGVEISNLKVSSGKTQYVNVYLETGLVIQTFEMVAYKVPLIDASAVMLKTVTRQEYSKMATKNINSVLAQSAGVVSLDDESETQIRGNRSESSETFIDGMRVIGSSGLPQSANVYISSNQATDFLDTINTQDIAAKSLRNDFADYAFWQPDLSTDKNGEASFDVTFPDNITKWKTYVVGMNNKKYSGSISSYTRSFKKVMAQLEAPRFFIEGDQSQIIGKMFNVTSNQFPIKLSFTVNNKLQHQYVTLLNKSLLARQKIIAVNDTMHLQFEASLDNGFKDGELKKIPVYKKGLLEKKGLFIAMKKDSIYQLPTNNNFNDKTISIISNPIHFALADLKALQNYTYNCNEQMASKLKAYLLEEELLTLSGEKFSHKKQIQNLINKLEESQNDDGSWAWWSGGNAVHWITLHVYTALSKAKEKKVCSLHLR